MNVTVWICAYRYERVHIGIIHSGYPCEKVLLNALLGEMLTYVKNSLEHIQRRRKQVDEMDTR